MIANVLSKIKRIKTKTIRILSYFHSLAFTDEWQCAIQDQKSPAMLFPGEQIPGRLPYGAHEIRQMP